MPYQPIIREGQCEACHIFIDGVEEHYIEEYREHNICFHCQWEWQRREKLVGREITWEQFTTGKLENVKYKTKNIL